MKTIAITNWNGIVSPLYDVSCFLLIVNSEGRSKMVDIRNMSLFDKADLCFKEGVNVIICGAISNIGYAILNDKGITVFSWIRGSVDEIITDYFKNGKMSKKLLMPGCRHRTCSNRKRLGHQRGHCGMKRPSSDKNLQ